MEAIKKIFIILVVLLSLCACSKKPLLNANDIEDVLVTRFSVTDDKTGKRYSGIFNERREVLFYDEGVIYPFKGDFSFIHRNNKSNTAIDITGKTYTTFELSEVYDSFYGYGIYSSYDYNKDFSYLIDKNGNKIKEKNIIDISEQIKIIKKNKKMTYYNIANNSYLKNNQLYDICYNFLNGVAKVGMQKPNQPIYNMSYLYGLIDKNGYTLLPCEFTYLDYSYPEYVVVSKTCEDPVWDRKAEFGMVDLNNNWIIEPKYNYVLPIADSTVGLWVIENNAEYWILKNIDTQDTVRLNSNMTLVDNINIFKKRNRNDIIICYDYNTTKYGLIDSSGNFVLNAICKRIEPNPDNGYWRVLVDNKWMLFKEDQGLIDPDEYLDFSKVK